jgi:hypothetical protein
MVSIEGAKQFLPGEDELSVRFFEERDQNCVVASLRDKNDEWCVPL